MRAQATDLSGEPQRANERQEGDLYSRSFYCRLVRLVILTMGGVVSLFFSIRSVRGASEELRGLLPLPRSICDGMCPPLEDYQFDNYYTEIAKIVENCIVRTVAVTLSLCTFVSGTKYRDGVPETGWGQYTLILPSPPLDNERVSIRNVTALLNYFRNACPALLFEPCDAPGPEQMLSNRLATLFPFPGTSTVYTNVGGVVNETATVCMQTALKTLCAATPSQLAIKAQNTAINTQRGHEHVGGLVGITFSMLFLLFVAGELISKVFVPLFKARQRRRAQARDVNTRPAWPGRPQEGLEEGSSSPASVRLTEIDLRLNDVREGSVSPVVGGLGSASL